MGIGANEPPDNEPSADWFRGIVGWGTMSEIGQITQFQQDPSDDADVRAKEAAADMFLNWVYRYTTQGWIHNDDKCDNTVPIITQNQNLGFWLGFKNFDTTGNPNLTTLPGNVRFVWMQETMQLIFNNHQDWQ